jgi:betaine-aldehyde dehydrogenase
MYIGGEWVESTSGKRHDVLNPATGEVLASVPLGNNDDVNRAVQAAEKASKSWKMVPPEERGDLVRAMASIMLEKERQLAMLESLNVGHPIRAMRIDVQTGARDLTFFAGLYADLRGETIPGPHGRVLNYTMREPFGVVARIIPFNHPLMFAAQGLGAPLVAGNTVILKPASITPLSALLLAKVTEELFPPGVINIVTGSGSDVGVALARHSKIRRIAVTGSVETGREVARLGAENLKYVTLELGGKNPIVIFPDVDVDSAVQAATRGMNFTWTAGQSCQSTSRCFVHTQHHDEFVEKLVSSVSKIKLGIPTKEETEMGCLSSFGQLQKVEQYVKIGLSERARVVAGGSRPDDPELSKGFFYKPTVFDGVDAKSRLGQEEIFGPVLSVMEWNNYEEMVQLANSVEYGLTAIILSRDISNAHKLAADLEAGYIWINGPTTTRGVPFGGYKMSGIGRQGGIEELYSYTQVKSVQVTL